MKGIIDSIIDVTPIIVLLLPIVINLFSLIAQKSHNQKLINLSERSKIIVKAMEQTDMTNPEKKQEALKRLSQYSSQVGIKMEPDQLDDYIESAVNMLKQLNK